MVSEKDLTTRTKALGRRAADRVSGDQALELVCSLALEYALKNPAVNRELVEAAIEKCRELRIDRTGEVPALTVDRTKK